jgi:V8-like Glu-specific endopeptidase
MLLALTTVTIGSAEAGRPAVRAGTVQSSSGATVSGVSPLTPAAVAAGVRRYGEDADRQESLRAYWTPRRMRNATPVEESPELRQQVRDYLARQRTDLQARRMPATSDGPARTVPAAKGRLGSPVARATNPDLPHTHPTAYTNGKVFYSRGGQNYACSAAIVNTEGKDSVWTAGHCVHGGRGGSFHSNWTFIPAYDDDLPNVRPYGTWSSASLNARNAWTGDSDFSQDFGVATMSTNSSGEHIAEVFGGNGFAVNKGKRVTERSFGYPSESPFDGGNLMRCSGRTSPEWDSGDSWSQTLKVSCDMTRGSSGGPWLLDYNGELGTLNGVNSRIDRLDGPTTMLSPYFDDDAWDLYNDTRRD